MNLSSNSQSINHCFPKNLLIRSQSEIRKLIAKRQYPRAMEFNLESNTGFSKSTSKRISTMASKSVLKLKNPTLKDIICNKNMGKSLRKLQITPEEASKHITQITKTFTRVRSLMIKDEKDSFTPIRIKKKIHPLKFLDTFVYDHEFCREFMRCAIYSKTLKLRKTCLNFSLLKKFRKLENFYIILKTRYVALPEEDKKYIDNLSTILRKISPLKNISIEQEIDSEIHPQMFMDLADSLKEKATISLFADFVNVCSERERNNSIEKVLQSINNSGVTNLSINYVGIISVLKRFGRSFYAPIHAKKDLYEKFLKTLIQVPFSNVSFAPTIHSSYIDQTLIDDLVELVNKKPKFEVSRINMIYHLDLLEFDSLDLLLDLYNQPFQSYEITIINSTNQRRGLLENLGKHFSKALRKLEESKAKVSLQITTKNFLLFASIFEILGSKTTSLPLENINIQISEPLPKQQAQNLYRLIMKSTLFKALKKLEMYFVEKEAPLVQEVFAPLQAILNEGRQLEKLMLLYDNSFECRSVMKEVFDKLKFQNPRIELDYEINKERINFE